MMTKTISKSRVYERYSQSLSKWKSVLILIFLLVAVALVGVPASLLATPEVAVIVSTAEEIPASNTYSTNPELWIVHRNLKLQPPIISSEEPSSNPELSVVRRFRETRIVDPDHQ